MRKITNFTESDKYREKIHHLIPGGAHTYSKGDDQFPKRAPAAITHGKGSQIWDLDGNQYLDCAMGLAAISLGHAYEPVLAAVREEIERGVNFQRPSSLEMVMAESFLKLVPMHQRIKFSKNGSTVTTAAVKLARAHTGRNLVAFPSDHPFYSYDDWFIGKSNCNKGVPDQVQNLTRTFVSTDLKTLEKIFADNPGQIACVISEPEKVHDLEANYLDRIIELCHQNGALFIQDEMITGYKTGFPGTIAKMKSVPDLTTWGKGIGNGFSFCALTGKKEIMDLGGIKNTGAEKVFLISTTHGGETHAIAAALATMKVFQENNVVEYNLNIGKQIQAGCQKIIESKNLNDFIQVSNSPWMLAFTFKDKNKTVDLGFRTLFMQEMIERGVFYQGMFVPCYSHTQEDVNYFLQAFAESCDLYLKALETGYSQFLVGEPIKPVFRKYL